ncbi:putative surface-exposed virulence protein BigA [Microplitis demolitor]|uniref:putative surface-exposed virulence protein BigA n=1 Tax=Microplitis demolitor TaxID=69319 RepID=UPI00235B6E9A|nr:putative surface-exposed virulence protein BigA [Microplitis demolitor]
MSSFFFKEPNKKNLDDHQLLSSKSRMSSFVFEEPNKKKLDDQSLSSKSRMSAFSGSWPEHLNNTTSGSSLKGKSPRNLNGNSKTIKLTNNNRIPDTDDNSPGTAESDDNNPVDLDVTPPVGDLFDEAEDSDLDVTPPVGDLSDDDITPPVSPSDDSKTSDDSSDSIDLEDITPPVSPSDNFGEEEEEDNPAFDTWKITNSEGIVLRTGDDNGNRDDPQPPSGSSRVFHILPGDDQVNLTLSL